MEGAVIDTFIRAGNDGRRQQRDRHFSYVIFGVDLTIPIYDPREHDLVYAAIRSLQVTSAYEYIQEQRYNNPGIGP